MSHFPLAVVSKTQPEIFARLGLVVGTMPHAGRAQFFASLVDRAVSGILLYHLQRFLVDTERSLATFTREDLHLDNRTPSNVVPIPAIRTSHQVYQAKRRRNTTAALGGNFIVKYSTEPDKAVEAAAVKQRARFCTSAVAGWEAGHKTDALLFRRNNAVKEFKVQIKERRKARSSQRLLCPPPPARRGAPATPTRKLSLANAAVATAAVAGLASGPASSPGAASSGYWYPSHRFVCQGHVKWPGVINMAVAVTRTLEEGEATAEGLLSKSLKPRRCRCEGYFLLTLEYTIVSFALFISSFLIRKPSTKRATVSEGIAAVDVAIYGCRTLPKKNDGDGDQYCTAKETTVGRVT
ncbi:hypothetical protein V8E53_003919 [Lactarius tabidus]